MFNRLASRKDIHVIRDEAPILVQTISAGQILKGIRQYHLRLVKITEGVPHVQWELCRYDKYMDGRRKRFRDCHTLCHSLTCVINHAGDPFTEGT